MSDRRPVPAPPGSPDENVPWHFGNPHREQSLLISGAAAVDLGHREVLAVTGADRLGWLHNLTSAHLTDLAPGGSAEALVLSPKGHVEHDLHLADDGATTWISVEPGTGAALLAFLESMRFLLDVAVTARPDLAVAWHRRSPAEGAQPLAGQDGPTGRPGSVLAVWDVPADFQGTGSTPAGQAGAAAKYVPERPAPFVGAEFLLPRSDLARYLGQFEPAGTWALEALRVAAAVPRLGHETDHRSIPAEVGWIGPAVHLAKGCYRGQETVARVHNLGRPPRRLALAHLDGSIGILPGRGDPVFVGGREVGWVATPARHYELGPIATVIVKRGTDVAADFEIRTPEGVVVASQQVVVVP